VATALNKDDIELHIQDTINAGAGYNDKRVVELLSKESLNVIPNLINYGVPFDRDKSGNLIYTKEAAHSTRRIVRAGGDATGKEIHNTLLKINKCEIMRIFHRDCSE
jgi:L-aspartate oxidase